MRRKNKVSKKFAFKLLLAELKFNKVKHQYKCIMGSRNFKESKDLNKKELFKSAFELFGIIENYKLSN